MACAMAAAVGARSGSIIHSSATQYGRPSPTSMVSAMPGMSRSSASTLAGWTYLPYEVLNNSFLRPSRTR